MHNGHHTYQQSYLWAIMLIIHQNPKILQLLNPQSTKSAFSITTDPSQVLKYYLGCHTAPWPCS